MFYYSEDGKTFPNKLLAIDYRLKTNIPVHFYYYDDVYEKLDWSKVPIEPLDTLYKNQAQKIRDEYDYVVLCYSGGFDSTNILETFYYNNIKLDKIVTAGSFSKDKFFNSDENHNKEIYKNAFPLLTKLGLFSITQVIDYSTDLYHDPSNFSIFKYGDNWIEEIGTRFSPHNWFWKDLDKFIVPKEYQDKKVAIIWGTDKPNIQVSKDRSHLYIYFRDAVITSYGRTGQTFYPFTKHINFYWDPTFTDILVKQTDILKQHFLSNKSPDLANGLTNTLLKLIYNFKNPLSFKSGKTQSYTFSKRDNFLTHHKDSELFKFYNNGISKLEKYTGKLRCIKSKKHIIYNVDKK